jgi:arabinofuranosyltransferase
MTLQLKIGRPTLWFGLGAAACLLAVAFMTWAFLGYTQDDVYITYTYSRNLAEGHGLVFNPGEYVQGTTTPLWALTMAGVYKLTPDLQAAGNVLCGLLLLVTLFMTYHLTANALSLPARFLLLCGIASAPLFYLAYGMETMLYCAVLAAAFVAWSRNRYHLAFALAGVLTWTRADGVVLAGTFGLCLLAKATADSRQPTADSRQPTADSRDCCVCCLAVPVSI